MKGKCVIELRFYLQHKPVAAQTVTTVLLLKAQNAHCIVWASYNITTMDSAWNTWVQLLKPLYVLRCTFFLYPQIFLCYYRHWILSTFFCHHFQHKNIKFVYILYRPTYMRPHKISSGQKKVSKKCLRSSVLECLEKSCQSGQS